ncbi:soluble guanylate cyclase gcy-33-like [Haliotis rufescens]|uniref:soluble guanylate cyclase gcy-33-like n=1 Tax=Haliotis rufescens TaxID=6454 RepID=UPI00201F4D1E|nr:soluble guanylate cyclase gcy-33-like [Haliotis rufescens]XP_046334855.2 soluble guanylate cyclase gcy-33-like [Haliotis rufescens]
MRPTRVHAESSQVNMSSFSQASVRSRAELDDAVRKVLGGHRSRVVEICKGNPVTNSGKRIQMAKMLTLTIIPTVMLVVLSILDVVKVSARNQVGHNVQDMIRLSTDVGKFIHYIQRERGYTSLHISATASTGSEVLLRNSFRETNEALETLGRWPGETQTPMERFPTKENFLLYLEDHRDSLLTSPGSTTLYKEVKFYNNVIRTFITWLYKAIQFSQEGDNWRMMVAYQLLLTSKNDIGVERTLGSVYYLTGEFNQRDYLWYLRKKNVGNGNFEASKLFSPLVESYFKQDLDKQKEPNITQNIENMRVEISSSNGTILPSAEKSKWWFDNMTVYLDVLFDTQLMLADVILESLNHEFTEDIRNISLSIALLCAILIICPLIVISVRALVSDIQRYAFTLADQTKELTRERQRTESLLYQMIPKAVADQLKTNTEVEAESYEAVTIFFSDIVGFTSISSMCTPMEVVALLNTLYTCFDARLEIYDVYKVETIGDAYMVASGVPRKNGNKHAVEVATMALDLAHHVTHLEIPHSPNTPFRLRAGVHTGPVVAGVVGSKMPRYCLFGDTVNTASRMESTGMADRVQLSNNTYYCLKGIGGYSFERRGEIEVKGKGLITTYWLLNKDGFDNQLPCMPGCKKYTEAHKRRISEYVQPPCSYVGD